MSEIIDTAAADAAAQRRQAAVDYVWNLIDNNPEVFMQVYGTEEVPEEQRVSFLLEQTTMTLTRLMSQHTRAFGVQVRHLPLGALGEDTPAVALGWAQFHPALRIRPDDNPNKQYPHFLRLSEQGKTVVNGYRIVLGLRPLDEQAKRNRQAWESALQRHGMDISASQ